MPVLGLSIIGGLMLTVAGFAAWTIVVFIRYDRPLWQDAKGPSGVVGYGTWWLGCAVCTSLGLVLAGAILGAAAAATARVVFLFM